MKKNYFLTIIFTILSFLSVYSQCDHTFVMNDSYGDGWNGSTVDILVDGVVVLEAATAEDAGVTSGSTENLLFTAAEGSSITLANWTTGSWTTEVSWSIIDGAGLVLASGVHAEVADIIANCTPPSCYVPAITSWNMTIDGLIVDGTNVDEAIGYTLEYSETTFTPGDGTATVYEFDSFPHTLTGLAEGTTYYFAMQSNCGDSVSDWIGSPDEWTTQFVGSTAYAPIVIESIPYATSDDTINYGDDYTNTALGCGLGIGYYLNGDDVVYLYTAASTMSLNVNLAPSIGEGGTSANYAGMYVYENAEDVGVNCWIAELELGFSSEPASFELSVTEGSTYYFVISTWAAPQNIAYDLSITELLCGTPTNLAVSNVTAVSADVSWDAGEAVSWEYVSSTVEDSSVPTEAGTSIDEPTVAILNCYPITGYDVWVRAVCEDGSTSEWISTTFTTAFQAPECGESISQYEYPNGTLIGTTFATDFDINNDYSSDLVFTTTAGDQDEDGYTDEISVTISGSTENNYDWIFVTNGAGELLYGPISGDQLGSVVTSTDGTINVYLPADGSVAGVFGEPLPSFDVSCAGLSVNDFDLSNLKIYPNPVNGDYVTIQSPISGDKNIEVYDITGKRLINTILNSDKLDISSVSAGVYLVKVTVQGQSKVSKLIIR